MVRAGDFGSTAPNCHLTTVLKQRLDETARQYPIATKGAIRELKGHNYDGERRPSLIMVCHPCGCIVSRVARGVILSKRYTVL